MNCLVSIAAFYHLQQNFVQTSLLDCQLRHNSLKKLMDKFRETGLNFDPKFDSNGLLAAVVTDADSGDVLMLAYMNDEAIRMTLETGKAHFFSRSRQKLWLKGETSGNFLNVQDMRIDCDQDALWVIAKPVGPTCHTGANSCFYRQVTATGLQRL